LLLTINQLGMLLAKIGGPVYRIGVGGGAASSVEVQGDNSCELDFNAVQRGDAEMENKLNRVVRACIEMGEKNPILAIHDQVRYQWTYKKMEFENYRQLYLKGCRRQR
jgi:phosphoribosylformylglycinamidine (FGAM) synthase-like enzyme